MKHPDFRTAGDVRVCRRAPHPQRRHGHEGDVLQSVGLPAEAIAILLPIDRLLDTVRTVGNVEGDMIGSLVVQRFV